MTNVQDQCLNELEQAVVEALLRGNHPVLEALRQQHAAAQVRERKFTGVGFFTTFQIGAVVPRVPAMPRLVIGDVYGEITALEQCVGFLLFVKDGLLELLECFIHDPEWPAEARLQRLYYVHPETPGSSALAETKQRDLAFALKSAF